jgi:putative membrane protein insertion efficiency factor
MKIFRTIGAGIVEAAFAFYALISPVKWFLFGPAARCRFSPTCSNYAREYIRNYGLRRAVVPILRRFLRCHPFGLCGHDPVP